MGFRLFAGKRRNGTDFKDGPSCHLFFQISIKPPQLEICLMACESGWSSISRNANKMSPISVYNLYPIYQGFCPDRQEGGDVSLKIL